MFSWNKSLLCGLIFFPEMEPWIWYVPRQVVNLRERNRPWTGPTTHTQPLAQKQSSSNFRDRENLVNLVIFFLPLTVVGLAHMGWPTRCIKLQDNSLHSTHLSTMYLLQDDNNTQNQIPTQHDNGRNWLKVKIKGKKKHRQYA